MAGRGSQGARRPQWLLVAMLLTSALMCCSWWLLGRRRMSTMSAIDALAQAERDREALRMPVATGLIVNSSRCRLPDYDPWDSSVAGLIRQSKRFTGCRQTFPVRLTQEGRLLRASVSKDVRCRIRCCYRSVMRRDEGSSDERYMFGNKSMCFEEGTTVMVSDEFVQVRCYCQGKEAVIYEDFRAFIVPKPSVEKLLQSARDAPASAERLNVYLIGLDSVSRLQLKRFMPDIEFLLATDFDAVPMSGLTKVGVNTFPNMLAFLAGMEIDEVTSLRDRPFDDLPIVWKHFSRLGYVTMFNEDTPSEATFNYLKQGFYVTPTDYYMRPFYRALEDSRFIRSKETLCVNQRDHLDLQLHWLQDLMSAEQTAKSPPQFALLFSSTLSHKGPLPYVEAMQARLEQFLLWYRNSPRYNTSFMFLFSDHGMRFGPVMQRELGGYESRLPFFYVIPPPWYSHRYPERMASLRNNSRRLTTFYDAHATLRQLLLDFGAEKTDLPVFKHPGVSLFQPVPSERSCEDAGIGTHWCACHARRPVPVDSELAQNAAAAAVRHIYTVLLRDLHSQCAKMTLSRVTAAFHTRSQRRSVVADTDITLPAFDEYSVKFVTSPGAAEFEATVRTRPGGGGGGRGWTNPAGMTDEERWLKTAGERADSAESARQTAAQDDIAVVEVSRLNIYAGQSDCLLTQWDERRFCYCKNLLS